MANKMVYKGDITLNEKVMVSDPCYGLGTWCQHIIENVLPGKFKCYVSYFYDKSWCENYRRVSTITIRHEGYTTSPKEEIGYAGIDSGQCGIYDLNYYTKYHDFDRDKNQYVDDGKLSGPWYDKICKLTNIDIKNERYVEFEQSEFWSSDFNNLFVGDLNSKSEYILKYYEAISDWEHSISGRRYHNAQDANIIDDDAFVSGTGYGDGVYPIMIGRNEDGKIVSIKIKYK